MKQRIFINHSFTRLQEMLSKAPYVHQLMEKSTVTPKKPELWPEHPALGVKLLSGEPKPRSKEESPKEHRTVSGDMEYIRINFMSKELDLEQVYWLKHSMVMLRAVGMDEKETQRIVIPRDASYQANVSISDPFSNMQCFMTVKDSKGNDRIAELDEFCLLSLIGCPDDNLAGPKSSTPKYPESGILVIFSKSLDVLLADYIHGIPRINDIESAMDAVRTTNCWRHRRLYGNLDNYNETLIKRVFGPRQ